MSGDTKWHFAGRHSDPAICGVHSRDTTSRTDDVDCKHCLRKLPVWIAEQERIKAQEEATEVNITLSLYELKRLVYVLGAIGWPSAMQMSARLQQYLPEKKS